MSIAATDPTMTLTDVTATAADVAPDRLWRRILGSRRIVVSGSVLLAILLLSVLTLPWTYFADRQPTRLYYDRQDSSLSKNPASNEALWRWFGTDIQGR